MELTSHQTDGILHITTRLIGDDCIIEYHNKEDKRHRENGPAIKANIKEQNNNEYCEWWNNGKLVAIFNKNKDAFLKSNDGTHDSLYKIKIPEQLKGSEKNFSLNDIDSFNELVLENS